MKSIQICLLLTLLTIQSYGRVFLVKRHDTVFINKGYIGLTTTEKSYPYKEFKSLSYFVESFNKDSLIIMRPVKYHDTVVSYKNYSAPYVAQEHRFHESFHQDGKLMCKLYIIDQYEYDVIDTKKITSISYPPISEPNTGCIFCIFMPVFNIFYLHNVRKHYIPKTYDLNKWTLMFDHK